jgi:hypothetical protein
MTSTAVFSLSSPGGEGWGEEASTKESPELIEQPLSPTLAPLVPRGAREKTFAIDRFLGRKKTFAFDWFVGVEQIGSPLCIVLQTLH